MFSDIVLLFMVEQHILDRQREFFHSTASEIPSICSRGTVDTSITHHQLTSLIFWCRVTAVIVMRGPERV